LGPKRPEMPKRMRDRAGREGMEWIVYDDAGADGDMQLRARGFSTYSEAAAFRDKEHPGSDLDYVQSKRLDEEGKRVGLPRGGGKKAGRKPGTPNRDSARGIAQRATRALEERGIEHKFNYIGTEPYIPNQKTRAAGAERAIAKEKEDAGLFAEQTEFDSPEERVARLNRRSIAFTEQMIRQEGDGWLKAIERLDTLSPADRADTIAEWNKRQGPKSHEYFADMLTQKARIRASLNDTTMSGFADPFTAAAAAFYNVGKRAWAKHQLKRLGVSPYPMPEPTGMSPDRPQIRPFELARKIKATFNPGTLGKEASGTEGTLRNREAVRFREHQQAIAALRSLEIYIDRQPRAKQIELWKDAEHGDPTGDPFVDAMLDVFREITDKRTQRLITLGRLSAQRSIENYIGRFWTTENRKENAVSFLRSIFAKRPFEGPKSFLKMRSLENFTDGLHAGLIPPTYNFVTSQLAKIAEMDRL